MNGMDERKPWRQAAAVLPPHLRDGLHALGEDRLDRVEEFRLRRGFPMTALVPEGEVELDTPPVGEDGLRQVVENATQSSAHTALDRVRQGFVTLRGGHRVGMCGSVVRKEGRIVTLRELSSLSIRVARTVPGLAGPLLPGLTEEGRFVSTLIAAPPGAGKTTLLRGGRTSAGRAPLCGGGSPSSTWAAIPMCWTAAPRRRGCPSSSGG